MNQAWIALALISASLAGCATGGSHRETGGSTAANGRIEIAHSFHHEVKTAQGLQRQYVEHGWDYDRAVAFQRIHTPDGVLIEQRDQPGLILRATDQEMEVAYELVRQHPDLASTVNVAGAEFEGGFIHMIPDDPLCHIKTRCVYVLVSLDRGRRKIAQALVDLQSGSVAYPRFDPAMIDD